MGLKTVLLNLFKMKETTPKLTTCRGFITGYYINQKMIEKLERNLR